ncbi:MAG: conjugal transfer protein TrbI [Candidatus Adiutrix sp.]|jgi:type IV secretion system protein VirB10|nr:conjugal transfer protein TrbI [Candidatus Adiutrix sp.]
MSEKSASPGFLSTGPKVKKTDRRVLMAILVVVTGLLVVLMFGLSSQKEDGSHGAGFSAVEQENKPLSAPVEGLGLALPLHTDNKPASREPETTTYVGPPPVDPDLEAARREADEIRRRKFERAQLAYSSVLLVKRDRAYSANPDSVEMDRDGYTAGQSNSSLGPDGYDPAADRDKEAFFVRADARDWVSPYTREAGRKFEVKTGTVIPGVMVSGVNSDLPGSLIAQVTQNVYDTASGRHLLLPQGAKLYGVYDSRVVYGQERVLIAWNRVVFPDGSSVTLGAMPGADMAGYAGFNDQVNNHYLRIFGSAIMMSLITGGMSYAIDQASDSNNGGQTSTTMQDEMISALAAQLGQTTLQLLQKNLNIKPTLEIRPGYQFNVIITKDMVFRGPYAAAY